MNAALPTIETARLRLRPFTLADDAFIVALLNTPGWLRFIGDRQVRDTAGARRYLEAGPLAMYARHGLGLLMVERRSDATPLGMAGLLRRDGLDSADLGFALLPPHAGQGFAFEAAEALLDDARQRLRLPSVCAITDPANGASIALLERLGFMFDKPVQLAPDQPALRLFRLALHGGPPAAPAPGGAAPTAA